MVQRHIIPKETMLDISASVKHGHPEEAMDILQDIFRAEVDSLPEEQRTPISGKAIIEIMIQELAAESRHIDKGFLNDVRTGIHTELIPGMAS